MKIWKPKHYEAIPHYVKPHFIDIHDTYKLRSKDEVLSELRKNKYSVEFVLNLYSDSDKDQ